MNPSEAGYGWAADDPRWSQQQRGGAGFGTPAPDDTARIPPLREPGGWPAVPPAPTPYGAPDDATSFIPPVPAAPVPPTPMPVHAAYPGAAGPPVAPPPWQVGGQYPSPRDPDQTVVLSRLDRRVQARSRRRGDDEFRRAGRAELFSDDARYGVVFALTAAWHVPVALVLVLWVLGLSSPEVPASTRLLDSLPWLAGSTVLSLAIVGLLRWAHIGWRALTLSIAAVLIGGGVVTVAHSLSG